ncbi:hypothetical protein Hdeb2414_s0016g00491641 [Helianthus debilis subsp. tardiflorus]
MSFPLYNFPFVQKRTGCTPLKGIVFLFKKKQNKKLIGYYKLWAPPSTLFLCGDFSPNHLPDLATRLDGGTSPARQTWSPKGVTKGGPFTLIVE